MNRRPTEDEMYQALVDRDPEFDGVFWVCVRTTGIFCRPMCWAKKPKRENVEFAVSIQAALQSGYRPCLKCRPLEQADSSPDWFNGLMAHVDRDPLIRINDARLRHWSLDPATVRRYFKNRFGITFHAYQRARKMGHALQMIRKGERTSAIAFDTGYESESGFREAFSNIFGCPPGKSILVDCLVTCELKTPLGSLVAVAGDAGLCMLEFLDRRMMETQVKRIRTRFRASIVPGQHPYLQQTRDELEAYFAGELTEFHTPIDLRGTEFQRSVWNALLKIPFASTRSYSQIAEAVGKPQACRAVGRTNGENPIAIIVPCHRVIRHDGNLCGYGGGLWRKQWLLNHEQQRAPRG
jgi:AraC family transcriptional regulator of adaptative response/methylated-DNA-[protein]-cysteine methyltransferase